MRPTLPQILKADRQVFLYLIRVGVDLKRQPDNTLLLDSMMLTALQSYEVGFHLLPLPQLGSKSGGPTAPSQGSTHDSKGKGGSWGDRPSPYKGKGGGSSTNGKSKGGKAVLPKFLLGRDNTNMNSVRKHLMVVSAQGAGICVAAAVAMRRIQSVTTVRRRSDMKAASALLHVLVRAFLNVLSWKFLQALAASRHVGNNWEWPVRLGQIVCGTNRPCRR